MKKESYEIQPLGRLDGLIDVPVEDYPGRGYQPYSSYNDPGEEEQTLHFREIIRRLRKHKWLILSIAVIVTGLVTIQVYRIKPWYSSSAIIEIGKENNFVVKAGDMTLSDDSEPNYIVDLNTRLLVLSSTEFYDELAADLKLESNPRFGIAGQTNANNSQTPDPANAEPDKAAYSRIGSAIREKVSTSQIRNTRAIEITVTDEDPNFATEICNEIARSFMDQNFDQKTEKFSRSAEWLDASTRELKAKVEQAEEALGRYSRENGIYSTDMGSEGNGETLTTSKLTQLHDQYIKVQTERTLKQSLYEQLVSGRISELPDSFSDSMTNDAKKKLADLEKQDAELRVKFGPEHPRIEEIKNQIKTVKDQLENSKRSLVSKIKADFQRAQRDEKSIGLALEKAKADAVDENQAAIKYNILKQDVRTSRELYEGFLKQNNQTKAQLAEQSNNMKVIQKAQLPNIPDGPRKTQIVILGFLVGLGGGIGLAFFLEYLDNTIKTLDDVDRFVHLPTLGVIPGISKSVPFLKASINQKQIETQENGSHLGLTIPANDAVLGLVNTHESHSITGEAYRGVRTSLLLSSPGDPPQTILVTSSIAGEGKTTTCVNLAISLARLGGKVIVLDCDLRRPSVHKQLNISPANGVTNFLSSHDELEPLIQRIPELNLAVLPSGPIPPNPAELLSSRRMKEMIAELEKEYDHILIDSPPILNVSDPVILSTVADGTILVVHSGKAARDSVQRSRNDLFTVKAKIFGVVLNNVDLRKEGYDYYYYRYSKYNHYNSNGHD